ncbi:hypothetical protein Plhal304r1_c082g0167071 [Plasmopara halstedii]
MRAHPRSVIDPRVEYGFRSADLATEAEGAILQSLGVCIVGPRPLHKPILTDESSSSSLLGTSKIPMESHRVRLCAQKEGTSIPAMQMILLVLAPGDAAADDAIGAAAPKMFLAE